MTWTSSNVALFIIQAVNEKGDEDGAIRAVGNGWYVILTGVTTITRNREQ